MGYRSTFVTDDMPVRLPQWFVEKWENSVHFNNYTEQPTLPISSKQERKAYCHWGDILTDLSRVLREGSYDYSIHFVFLHEDGALTQYLISKNEQEEVLNTGAQD